jgi:hypothetical protein
MITTTARPRLGTVVIDYAGHEICRVISKSP